jgi:Flp pilus assembly protein TadG
MTDLLHDDRGMVTVEAAFAIAAVVAVLLAVVGAIGVVTAQIRCTDAAREVARLSAAGDPQASDAGRRLAGDSASITLQRNAEQVTAEVSVDVPMFPLVDVTARAVAAVEPEGDDQVRFAPGVQDSG